MRIMTKHIVFILTTLAIGVRAYVIPWSNNNNQLHPVRGLFVKPSDDGTTGDLYVAATEDNGVKSQWLTDQPVNFLPATATAQSHQSAIPFSYVSSFSPAHDEGTTQKRAIMSPPIQYTYAIPYPSSSGDNVVTPFSYTVSASSASASGTENTNTTPCSLDPAKANVPQYSPFQFFYPQMMTAYANAISVLKDAGLSDDTANSVMSQSSLWPPYAYPMYVMMDPSAWSQAQTPSTSTTSTVKSNNETP